MENSSVLMVLNWFGSYRFINKNKVKLKYDYYVGIMSVATLAYLN